MLPYFDLNLDQDKKDLLLNALRWEKILGTALGLFLIAFLVRLIRAFSDRMARRWAKRRLLLLQLRNLLVFAVYFLGALAVVWGIWGLSHEGILLFGIALLISFGFAFKPVAESLIGGLVLVFDGPFQVGDRVTFKGIYGDVRSIGLRATRLLTLDETLVTIPNHLFLEEAAFSGNAGVLEMMTVVDIYAALQADLVLAKKLIEEAVTKTAYVDHQKPVVVLAKEVALGSLPAYRLRAKVFVQDFVKEKLLETDLTLKVHELFQQHRIPRPMLTQANLES